MRSFNIADLESEFLFGTLINPEPSSFEESVLTVERLNELAASLPAPSDDRIFVVRGYWPHDYLVLTKDNGKHFILNDVGLRKLKKECAEYQPDYNHFSGIRIEYINSAEAGEMIGYSRKNEFEITGAKTK